MPAQKTAKHRAKFGWPLVSDVAAVTKDEGKTRNPLKFAWLPQTGKPISAVIGPKFVILWAHVEEILLFNNFFFRLSIHALVVKIQPNKVVRWCPDGQFLAIFLGPAFPTSSMQHISDLHSKFTIGPHHVQKYDRHPICDR